MTRKEAAGCTGHFMVVDDDIDQVTLMAQALKRIGCDLPATYVHNGHDALTSLENMVREGAPLPCLILLDIAMPFKDGFTTLAEIRANPTLQRLPVVMYSTSSLAGDITRSYEQGASAYCVKPRNFAELMHLLALLLRDWCKHVVSGFERAATTPVDHLFLDSNGKPRG